MAAALESSPVARSPAPPPARPLRTLGVIARMNVGGPAHHVAILDGGLARRGHETLLVSGRLGPGEAGSFEDLAVRHGARHRVLAHLRPELRPADDLLALLRLVRLVRRFRPDVVHTHTAKAGALGRVAVRLALPARERPAVVHTFHGHVLAGTSARSRPSCSAGSNAGSHASRTRWSR